MKQLLFAFMLAGCASGPPPLTAGACDPKEVLQFSAQCRLQVELNCDPNPAVPCAAEELCDEELCKACPKDVECKK